ncbi:putative disease resistance protein [Forsythia ovata]|uniref:Disease resistance protein n=1 Tax=Forsythia ovata TaxID=205694 RepID=A0ABD1WTP9_9LAMI
MDKLNTKALRHKLMETDDEVRALIPKFCTNFSIGDFMINGGMDSILEELEYRFEGIIEQISVLSLVGRLYRTGERLQVTLISDETDVYCSPEDKERIVELLRFESNDGNYR